MQVETSMEKRDRRLIKLFLSEYEGGTWADGLADPRWPEDETDRGLDALVTRRSDGLTLAVEHTLIEPFPGEKSDYHGPFKRLQKRLRDDVSLRPPGLWLRLSLAVGAFPPRSRWQEIGDEIAAWLCAEHHSFQPTGALRRCPCPSHPGGALDVWVAAIPLGENRSVPVFVERHGDMRVPDSVVKALDAKLPKLVDAPARRRLLMLERDQGSLVAEDILTTVDLCRTSHPGLSRVDELWIADTATFEEPDTWVRFSYDGGSGADRVAFEFYRGVLLGRYRNGMPEVGR
jgi:hypothetical protein